MKTLIVEDELASRKLLEELLAAYCPEVEVVVAVTTVADAVKVIKQKEVQLVLLDIELPREDGLSLFRYFDQPGFATIFTTSYDEYAIEAFKLSAIDYLLKPISGDELFRAVQKAKKQTPGEYVSALQDLQTSWMKKAEKIGLPTMSGFEFYKVRDIIRAEADGRCTEIHLFNGRRVLSTKNMGEHEKSLRDFGFFRVHRSHLVNLSYVKKYQRGNMPLLELDDGTIVPVAGRKKEELLRLLHLG